MKNIWIVANWKSNETIAQALEWVSIVGPELQRREDVKVAVCPTFLALEEVKKAVLVGNFPLLVGSQDLSPFEDGPYTGEESAQLLKEIIDLSIIGHSERRIHFGETDAMIADKVTMAQKYGVMPLLCVQNETTPVPDNVKIVAYEPPSAIGTGHPDTPDNANNVAQALISSHPSITVLYGGSVKQDNASAFLQQEHLSGLLIGGASLDPHEFVTIIKQAYSL